MLTVLDLPRIRAGGAEPGVELLLDLGVLLEHGDEGVAQDAGQLALEMRPHVLQQTDRIYRVCTYSLCRYSTSYFRPRLSAFRI